MGDEFGDERSLNGFWGENKQNREKSTGKNNIKLVVRQSEMKLQYPSFSLMSSRPNFLIAEELSG